MMSEASRGRGRGETFLDDAQDGDFSPSQCLNKKRGIRRVVNRPSFFDAYMAQIVIATRKRESLTCF